MSALKKISDKFGHLDSGHHLNKFSLVLVIAIFAAIPITVFGALAVRQLNPQAATNPYAATGLQTSVAPLCTVDGKVNLTLRWTPAAYAIASDRQYVHLSTTSSFSNYQTIPVTGRTYVETVYSGSLLYWRHNTHYPNGASANSSVAYKSPYCSPPGKLTLDRVEVISGCYGGGMNPVFDVKLTYTISNLITGTGGWIPNISGLSFGYDGPEGREYRLHRQAGEMYDGANGTYTYIVRGLVARGPFLTTKVPWWSGSVTTSIFAINNLPVPCTPSPNRCDVNFSGAVNSGDNLAHSQNIGKTDSASLLRYDLYNQGTSSSINSEDSPGLVSASLSQYCGYKY